MMMTIYMLLFINFKRVKKNKLKHPTKLKEEEVLMLVIILITTIKILSIKWITE